MRCARQGVGSSLPEGERAMRFVIVTGMSGAGKRQAIKHLEDLGFFCVDNLPPALLSRLYDICLKSQGKLDRVAAVIDIRGKELLNGLFPELEALKGTGCAYEILYLDASDEALVKRFKESRRAHPLLSKGRLLNSIREERRVIEILKPWADRVIDTTDLSTGQLKDELDRIFCSEAQEKDLYISIVSFGFKYGIPIDSDLVFDVRFIPNPFYVGSMRKLTGKDRSVREYVLSHAETSEFLEKLDCMLEFLVPKYIKEGKSQLVIGVGCTGGRHRSVVIADELYKMLCGKYRKVIIEHRDIDKDLRSAIT